MLSSATKPVGAAWSSLWSDRDFSPLFGGAVLPAWRRRGIYRAMVAARARAAERLGIRWLVVDASEESAPILRQLGFAEVASRVHCRWIANADGL